MPKVSKDTAEKIADEYKVDEKTVRRNESFAQAVNEVSKNTGTDVQEIPSD